MNNRKAVCPECGSPQISRICIYRFNEGECAQCKSSFDWSDRVFHNAGTLTHLRNNKDSNVKILFLLFILCLLLLSGCGRTFNCSNNYLAEAPGVDYWQTEKETRTLRSGDCEDFAYLTYKENAGSVVVVGFADGITHAWLKRSNGTTLDTCLYNTKEYQPMIELSQSPEPTCEVVPGGSNLCDYFFGNWKNMLQRERDGK